MSPEQVKNTEPIALCSVWYIFYCQKTYKKYAERVCVLLSKFSIFGLVLADDAILLSHPAAQTDCINPDFLNGFSFYPDIYIYEIPDFLPVCQRSPSFPRASRAAEYLINRVD